MKSTFDIIDPKRILNKSIVWFGRVFLLGLLLTYFANNLNAQYTPVPDINFENKLIALGIDTDPVPDGQILTSDAAAQTGALVVRNSGISDLTGIGAFVNITYLYCSNNQLSSLDLSSNLALSQLIIITKQ